MKQIWIIIVDHIFNDLSSSFFEIIKYIMQIINVLYHLGHIWRTIITDCGNFLKQSICQLFDRNLLIKSQFSIICLIFIRIFFTQLFVKFNESLFDYIESSLIWCLRWGPAVNSKDFLRWAENVIKKSVHR